MGQNLRDGWSLETSFTTLLFNVASGVGSSVGYPVRNLLILSGQCRQCRVTVFNALDGPKTERFEFRFILTPPVFLHSPKLLLTFAAANGLLQSCKS